MDEFFDKHGCLVRLAFHQHAFKKISQHVLVICRYQNKWLLTHHKQRGWEFPGGKKEPGETLTETALREVFEETGAIIDELELIGEYEVSNGTSTFVKTIFYGVVYEILSKEEYLETNGPVFEEGDILEQRFCDYYSFLMKDAVIGKSIELIKKRNLKRKKTGISPAIL